MSPSEVSNEILGREILADEKQTSSVVVAPFHRFPGLVLTLRAPTFA